MPRPKKPIIDKIIENGIYMLAGRKNSLDAKTIDEYSKHISKNSWKKISTTQSLSFEMLKKYKDKFSWGIRAFYYNNMMLFSNKEVLEELKEYIDWNMLDFLTEDLINEFSPYIHIEKYRFAYYYDKDIRNYLNGSMSSEDIEFLKRDTSILGLDNSMNNLITLSADFLRKHSEVFDFRSRSHLVPYELLEENKNILNWSDVSYNELDSVEKIMEFKDVLSPFRLFREHVLTNASPFSNDEINYLLLELYALSPNPERILGLPFRDIETFKTIYEHVNDENQSVLISRYKRRNQQSGGSPMKIPPRLHIASHRNNIINFDKSLQISVKDYEYLSTFLPEDELRVALLGKCNLTNELFIKLFDKEFATNRRVRYDTIFRNNAKHLTTEFIRSKVEMFETFINRNNDSIWADLSLYGIMDKEFVMEFIDKIHFSKFINRNKNADWAREDIGDDLRLLLEIKGKRYSFRKKDYEKRKRIYGDLDLNLIDDEQLF